jgi:hypothetical protein
MEIINQLIKSIGEVASTLGAYLAVIAVGGLFVILPFALYASIRRK